MRVVVDAVSARAGSQSVIVEELLRAWTLLETGDELHLVTTALAPIRAPEAVHVHLVPAGSLRQVLAQSTRLRAICRKVDADVLLASIPASSMLPVGCPRVSMVLDLRHELRPEQFSRKRRALRWVSWNQGYRLSAALVCISSRTRDDLLRGHPWLTRKLVTVAHLGADHTDTWTRHAAQTPYAIAFGHFANKGIDELLEAWALVGDRRLVLLGASDRPGLHARAEDLGISDQVDIRPWLSDEEFRRLFASAHLVVLPSDFEGFGLPAVEAMRLGIRLVVSCDPALLEVTAGHAVVAASLGPQELSSAVALAWDADVVAAQDFAARYTWAATAEATRAALVHASTGR